METPTPAEFVEKFRDVIRVGLNWQRFLQEQWPVEVVILRSPDKLSRCFMPWYIGVAGDEVAYDTIGAVPMRLTDVPKSMPILNLSRQTDIQEYVEAFRQSGGVAEFETPTYALPDNQYFVLDGNHRLSALSLRSGIAFKVQLWNIQGPLDPDCLLDLVHWQSKK